MRIGNWKFTGVMIAAAGILLSSCGDRELFYTNVLRADQFVQSYDEYKYDFLWVMDNSGSMKPRRDYIRDNMQTFMNILNSRKAIDFRMAMTSVDMFTDQGKLITDTNGNFLVSSESANPIADFAGIINNVQESDTSFWEQSLESMHQALYVHGNKFLRKGVPLIIILVTDSDDWSCKDNCWGGPPEEHQDDWTRYPIERYISYLTNLSNANESEISVFPITGTTDEDCDYEVVGARPIALQEAMGNLGKTGSICPSKLGDTYSSIAQVIADRGIIFKLLSDASGRGINVFVDKQLIPNSPENYIYDAESNSIFFTGAAPRKGQNVEITYVQKTE